MSRKTGSNSGADSTSCERFLSQQSTPFQIQLPINTFILVSPSFSFVMENTPRSKQRHESAYEIKNKFGLYVCSCRYKTKNPVWNE